MIEPVNGSVLQVRQGIMPRRSRQLVLAQHHLFLPRIHLIRRSGRRPIIDPITALNRLATVPPRRDAFAVDHLPFDVKAANQKRVALVLQELEDVARLGKFTEAHFGVFGEFFFDDLVAQVDALVADVDARARDQLLDLFL